MRVHPMMGGTDFRRLPSVVPLKSPSPDHKSMNVIIPTTSPNVIEIKKKSTPGKSEDKENRKCEHSCNTINKYENYSPSECYSNTLKSKD